MISFSADATDADVEAFCAQNGHCKNMGHPDKGGVPFAVVKESEKMLEASLQAQQSNKVAFVEQDAEAEDFVDSEEASLVSSSEPSWGVNAVGTQFASRNGNKGRGVNVYVLDSGVRVNHVEFGGRAIPFYDATFSPPKVCDRTDTACANDNRGHGSHVAGSVGGATHGVAPESTIWAMQRGNSLGDGYGCIDWLVQTRQTPAVLQMSWGTASPSSAGRAAVDAAVAAMMTVVVASGNSRQDACIWTFGGFDNVISVESTDSSSSRSSFSNFGPCIDMLAPGSSITAADYRSDTGLSVKSGTSMASPHVTGGAALILELNPKMNHAEVKQELQSNSLKDLIFDAQTDSNYFLWVGGANVPPTPAPGVTTLPPTPAPGSWGPVVGNGCEIDGECLQSKNYPSNYGLSEECNVRLYDVPLKVDGEEFITEPNWDYLTLNGVLFTGAPPPNLALLNGTHSGVLTWTSDDIQTSKGWRICRT